MKTKLLGVLVTVGLFGCNASPRVTCGAGTTQQGETCVPSTLARTCADGTHEVGGTCVADAVIPIACGAGTHLVDATCVIDTVTPPSSPWSAPKNVCPDGTACSEPQFVQTTAGAVIAVSESTSDAMTIAVYRQDTSGFVLAHRFSGVANVALTPSLAVRGATLYLAFTDYEPSQTQQYGTGDLMLSMSNDFGQTWTEPRRLNAQPATTLLYSPRLTVSAGHLDLVYVDTDGVSTQDTYWLHSTDDGVTFGAPVKLPSGGNYDSLSVAAAAVRLGDTLELPMQRSGYDLSTGAQLSAVEVLDVDAHAAGAPTTQVTRVKRVFSSRDFPLDPVPVLDANEAGVRCLAFVDAPSRDYSVFVVRSDGPLDGTQRPVLVPGGPGSVQTAPSIAVKPNGDCQLAWMDNRSGQWELYESTLRADGTFGDAVKVSPMGFTEDGVTHSITTKVQVRLDARGRSLVWADLLNGVESVAFATAPLNAD